VLFAVQAATIRFAPSEVAVRIVLPVTVALVPVALWPHRGRLGVWIIFVGLVANFCAIVANGGLMPIERETVVEAIGVERAAEYEPGAWIRGSKDVLVSEGQGRLTALGDGIVIRAGSGGAAASPGDIVVFAGLLVLAGEFSLAWHRRQRPADARVGSVTRADGSATTPT
jgi:hypothetical protein